MTNQPATCPICQKQTRLTSKGVFRKHGYAVKSALGAPVPSHGGCQATGCTVEAAVAIAITITAARLEDAEAAVAAGDNGPMMLVCVKVNRERLAALLAA